MPKTPSDLETSKLHSIKWADTALVAALALGMLVARHTDRLTVERGRDAFCLNLLHIFHSIPLVSIRMSIEMSLWLVRVPLNRRWFTLIIHLLMVVRSPQKATQVHESSSISPLVGKRPILNSVTAC